MVIKIMEQGNFADYIEFLRKNIEPLIKYQKYAGVLEPDLIQVKKDLFNEDPFVVMSASVEATKAFAAKNLFH